jgi:tetratricopeptide (TPR) repeat protein
MISEKTALDYLNDARAHVKNSDYEGAFLRYIRAGCFFRESSDLVNSFDCYNKAMQIFSEHSNKKEYLALVYSGFATYYRGVGNNEKFVENLSQSVKMHVSAAEENLAKNQNRKKKSLSLIESAISEYCWASFCSFLLGERKLAENLTMKALDLAQTKRIRIWRRELAKTSEALLLGALENAKTKWMKFQEKLSNDYLGETQYFEYIRVVENCFNIAKSRGK